MATPPAAPPSSASFERTTEEETEASPPIMLRPGKASETEATVADVPSASHGEPVDDSVLEGIELVPWAELTHAYGPAGDVPGHLRTLLRPEAKRRSKAWDDLEASIFHQGRVFPATSRAIPFFVRLLLCPEVPERARILRFLTNLSGGRTESVPGMPDYEDELKAVREVHDALRAAGPSFAELLADADAAVRASATTALAVSSILDGSSPRSGALLGLVRERMRQEADLQVLASEVLLLPHVDASATDLEPYLRHESELVRFAAALATCRLNDGATPESIAVLRAVLEDPSVEGFAQIPWCSAGVAGDACAALCDLGDELPADLFGSVLECFQRLSDWRSASTVGLALLRLTFGEPSQPYWEAQKSVPFSQLTERQRATLTAFARSNAVWNPIETRTTLGSHGLPMDRKGMRNFVGLPDDDPGPPRRR